ncbi:DUF1491 family protein [Roseospira marina]|uniref:DUF1491 family protein n=1 Tax=Roseospira marina TaxID=140057 RepID=A0A5M6I9K4_9PROT|nr:DUF1491 family protein [Roseospira marina]KAA5604873.1 DUF1491 family protein [Roseospira marina]MBB4315210.1 hypothetical protein [Roseospira marina]MBB5088210.1 hypothetical protein [Roseospira marina]
MPRLTAGLRARAILRLIETRGGFGAVVRRGDETAGDLLLRVRAPDGTVDLYAPATLPDGTAGWMRMGGPGYADAAAADAAVDRAMTRDSDLWVLDLEPAAPGFPLDDPVLDGPAEVAPTVAAAEALFRPKRA